MFMQITILARLQEGEVGFGRGKTIEQNDSLRTDERPVTYGPDKGSGCSNHRRLMTRPDCAQLDELAANKFQALVGTQNTGFLHAITVVDREKSLLDFARHTYTARISQPDYR